MTPFSSTTFTRGTRMRSLMRCSSRGGGSRLNGILGGNVPPQLNKKNLLARPFHHYRSVDPSRVAVAEQIISEGAGGGTSTSPHRGLDGPGAPLRTWTGRLLTRGGAQRGFLAATSALNWAMNSSSLAVPWFPFLWRRTATA